MRSIFILILIFAANLFLGTSVRAAGDVPAFTPSETRFVSVVPRIVVTGATVRLGDIFKGAGDNAQRVIAYAPRPGNRAVFDARWLKRVAQAFKLNWRPVDPGQNVIVERASRIVGTREIETLLHDRLVTDGGDANARAVLSNRNLRLYLPLNTANGAQTTLNIEQLVHFPASERFSAVISWGNAENERMRLTGRFERMSEVPVLAERVLRGDIIAKNDLKWIRLPENRLPRAAITDASLIVGMAAKHALQTGKPITQSDIRRPLMVNRGEIITVMLSTPHMQLTTKGRALEAGSRGDTIRISNLQTSTVIDAVVVASGQARIEPTVNLAMR